MLRRHAIFVTWPFANRRSDEENINIEAEKDEVNTRLANLANADAEVTMKLASARLLGAKVDLRIAETLGRS